jgi:hypothetical protein
MEDQIIEVISENDKTIEVKVDGKKVTLFKINVEEMNYKHQEDLYKASTYLTKNDVSNALYFTKRILQDIPNVDEYKETANELTSYMVKIYDILSPHKLSHLMHHLVKETDPKIYGKAQTFTKYAKLFYEELEEIIDFMDGKELEEMPSK